MIGRRTLARVATALATVVVAATALSASADAASATPTPLSYAVDRATTTAPLPDGFLGLALEYSTIPTWVGTASNAAGVNPLLVKLIRTLNPAGRPVIRIGGQSTDRSWWPVPKVTQPVGVTYDLGPSWARSAKLLAEALDARYILSVNLEADSPVIADYEAKRLLATVSPKYVNYFEIGNEPDLYTKTPWYRNYQGKDVPWYVKVGTPYFSRPADYNESDYLSEFNAVLGGMPANVPIAGPDSDDANWLGPFARQELEENSRIGMLDSHAYALFSCQRDPASPLFPTIPHLLALSAISRVLNGAERYVQIAHQNGLKFRIDEMGSVSCNGKAGVSDTMASALWVTDALFVAARGGADGVNLHSFPLSTNGLFDFSDTSSGWSAQVHPLYYGAQMFALADPEGSRLLRIPDQPDLANMRIWATIGPDHHVRVLLDNVGRQRTVTIHAPVGYGANPGTVERLLAPGGAAATSGLTLGGQSYGPSTTTATLPAPTLASVTPGKAGYSVVAPADSETLLTLSYHSHTAAPSSSR